MTVSGTFTIQQPARGYRYSSEPFIIADWVSTQSGDRVLDVGTGCGIIPLLMIRRQAELKITAVEIQNSLAQWARENVMNNNLADRVDVIEDDFLQRSDKLETGSFDWVVSNPPYRKPRSGRINPLKEKAVARHELTLNMSSLIACSRPLLKPKGRFVAAYPAHRQEELSGELSRHKMYPYRWLAVSGHKDTAPRFVLVEAGKEKSMTPPEHGSLVMYNSDETYSHRMREIYESFDYSGRSHRQR